MPRKPDLLPGEVFNQLTIIGKNTKPSLSKRAAKYHCKCACGKEVTVDRYSITKGHTKSCGCIKRFVNTKPAGVSAFQTKYNMYLKSAQRRGYYFKLTKEELSTIITQACYYCNAPPIRWSPTKAHDKSVIYCHGIDRVDNNLGYCIDNVVPCCVVCNTMKSNMDQESFLLHIKRIARNQEACREKAA